MATVQIQCPSWRYVGNPLANLDLYTYASRLVSLGLSVSWPVCCAVQRQDLSSLGNHKVHNVFSSEANMPAGLPIGAPRPTNL